MMPAKLKPATVIQRLVDELGLVSIERKKLQEKEDELKETLRRYGPGVYTGKQYDALLIEKVRTFFKSELLREHVDAELLSKCEIVTPYLSITTVEKPKLRVVK